MQMLSAYIAVAGDDANVVHRNYDTAITFPEMLILRTLHGSENIRRVLDVGYIERDSEEERSRLMNIYGHAIVKQLFPMDYQELPMGDSRIDKAPVPFWPMDKPRVDDDPLSETPAQETLPMMPSAQQRARGR